MQFTPLQLKEKLLGALDEDNNVVDATVVLEVISILEKFPITREALEQTRIGRHVNELRKKTNNEELAKRAKKLVRGWQKFLTLQDNCGVNGDAVSTPPQHRNVSVLQSSGNGSKPPSPAVRSPATSKSCVGQTRSSLSPAVSSKPTTPNNQSRPASSSKQNKTSSVSTPELRKSKLSPSLPKSSNTSNFRSSGSNPHQPVNANPSILQSSRLCAALGHTSSPKHQNQSKVDSSTKHANVYSPKTRPSTPCQSPQLSGTGRPATPTGNEDSLSSFPGTPTSTHSGHSQEVGNGLAKGKKHKTPPLIGGKAKVKKSNHSTESVVLQNSETGSRSDQSPLSRTEIDNHKRARPIADTPPVKQQKLDSSSHSLSTKHPLNGKLYPIHTIEKTKHNAVVNNSATLESARSCSSTVIEKSDALTPCTKKFTAKSDSLKSASALKTPKVKTTAELIAELRQKTGSASYGNVILEKLRTKQIEHEADVQSSVLPPGVKPRRKRKSNDSSYISVPSPSLSQTKTELVEKFLQTSVSPTSTDLSPHLDDFSVKAESPVNSSQNAYEEVNYEKIPILKPDPEYMHPSSSTSKELDNEDSDQHPKRLTIEEIYSQLPPIDLDNIDWESSDYAFEEMSAPVTNEDVERIQCKNWTGVNGCYDTNKVWHDWASTLTMTSYDDNPLHILPYVIVDD